MSHVLKFKEEIKRLRILKLWNLGDLCEIDSDEFNRLSSIRAKNISISGLLIQQQARNDAESLGIAEFKA